MNKKLSNSSYNEAKKNIFISYNLLKENWLAFAKTEIVALSIMVLIIVLSILVTNFLSILSINVNIQNTNFQLVLNFLFVNCVLLIFLTILTCQFGLANDIFTSGHMFADFHNIFNYFNRHWLTYTLLAFVLYFNQFLLDPITIFPIMSLMDTIHILPFGLPLFDDIRPDFYSSRIIFRQILMAIIKITTLILFVGILPGVTIKKNFKTAIQENFRFLRRNFLSISFTWLIYFAIFILPIMTFNILMVPIFHEITSNVSLIPLGLIYLLINLIFLFLSIPFMSILATRIYLSLDIADNSE